MSLRMFFEVRDLMRSFKRLHQYTQIESEDELVKHQDKELAEKKWPEAGELNFYNLSMKYREFLDPAINRLNCNIKPGMKVGIIGHTGSGKSSLVQVLLRLSDHCEGSL